MKFINLTPHVLNMVDHGDIEPSGSVARFQEYLNKDGDITIGGITGLPARMSGVGYVVSRPLAVALAMSGVKRDDVYVVRELLRNEHGHITGARGFARVVTA